MNTDISIGELAIGDPLDSMFENLRPVPRIEITEERIRFIPTSGETTTYSSITDALHDNQGFSGLIHLNVDFDENLQIEDISNV